MQALHLYAGPAARRHLDRHGLNPADIGVIPAAAGGPKGLILGPLDRFIFGEWLSASTQPIDLIGASIGAWRMATACLRGADGPVAALTRLEHDYIHQHYELPPGVKRPSPVMVSEQFGRNLERFYGGRLNEILHHPRYRLHLVAARGRHLLRTEHRLATPLGYLGAFVSNAVRRKAMGVWLERVVFSTVPAGQAEGTNAGPAPLPFHSHDYQTRQVTLDARNFMPALQASCSIPFVLKAVHDIPGAPRGAYWDGGITDYHLHLDYAPRNDGLVLYPHFQRQVVPGWLDKTLKWRHAPTRFLDRVLVLAPNPEWVKTLPNGKLPDRNDFMRYGPDLAARIKAWNTAVAASRQLADEFAQWLDRPDMGRVRGLEG